MKRSKIFDELMVTGEWMLKTQDARLKEKLDTDLHGFLPFGILRVNSQAQDVVLSLGDFWFVAERIERQ